MLREQDEEYAHFAAAPKKFFEAWRQAVLVAGPEFFGDGTKASAIAATDKWELVPKPEHINEAFGVLSSGQKVFIAALYSFYNSTDGAALWKRADMQGLADLGNLDLERRKLIAELILNYSGW
ncbi:TPA: hypothetical protein ACK3Q6_007668 [Burkholderia cepacia]